MCQTLDDMRQMFFHPAFRDAEQLSQLIGRQARLGQQIDHALAHRTLERLHGGMVSEEAGKCHRGGALQALLKRLCLW